MGFDRVWAAAPSAYEPVGLTSGRVVAPHLADRAHGDNVLWYPPKAGAVAATGEEYRGFHQSPADGALFVVLN